VVTETTDAVITMDAAVIPAGLLSYYCYSAAAATMETDAAAVAEAAAVVAANSVGIC